MWSVVTLANARLLTLPKYNWKEGETFSGTERILNIYVWYAWNQFSSYFFPGTTAVTYWNMSAQNFALKLFYLKLLPPPNSHWLHQPVSFSPVWSDNTMTRRFSIHSQKLVFHRLLSFYRILHQTWRWRKCPPESKSNWHFSNLWVGGHALKGQRADSIL